MADDSTLDVDFFDGHRLETRIDGEFQYEDLLLTAGSATLRITVEHVPPGFEAPVECPFIMEYPMYVMRGRDVIKLPTLISHAEARAAGLLLQLDFQSRVVSQSDASDTSASGSRLQKTILLPFVGERILNPLRCITYFAHRWPGPGIADNSAGSTLRLIQGCLQPDDYAWMDVWSVPDLAQFVASPGAAPAATAATATTAVPASSKQKVAAIRSLQAYVFRATKLCLVASSQEDYELFLERAWCQAELFAAFCPVVRRVSLQASINLCTKVYRHACEVEVVLGDVRDQWHGGNFKGPFAFDMTLLRNPLGCSITNDGDMPLLEAALATVSKALEAANPRQEVDEHSGHEAIITGMKPHTIDLLLKALSN